jgi:hypothetical protein
MAELGAIASVVALIGVGTKLFRALYGVASNVGNAAGEISRVARELSQFCTILNQVESTLTRAKRSVRYSITALTTIEQIAAQCRPALADIEEFLDKVKQSGTGQNLKGRVRWCWKRSKIKLLRKEIESAKLMLSCMLATLIWGETLASRRHVQLRT